MAENVARPGRARLLQPKILQHPPIDPVGGPVHLPTHHPFAVGRWTSAGRLDVAEIPGGTVELASEGLTTGHHLFSTIRTRSPWPTSPRLPDSRSRAPRLTLHLFPWRPAATWTQAA